MKRVVYGADARNASIAATLNNLGIVKFKRGDLDGAEAMWTDELAMRRAVHGADARHPDIDDTLACLEAVKSKRTVEPRRGLHSIPLLGRLF